MLKREDFLDLARKVDWDLTYVKESDAFPELASGKPWLSGEKWRAWDEPYRTSYSEYVTQQAAKEASVLAVRELLGRPKDALSRLHPVWVSALKLHLAVLPLAEFAATLGNLRVARFGRDSAWRSTALLGALDELRHAQLPLSVAHDLLRSDGQFDWAHRFYHSEGWVSIAARRLMDEMLVLSDPVEFAVATHFVFETGFTNLQFIALSGVARDVGDHLLEKLLISIQSDEARHAQIGHSVLEVILQNDREQVQRLVDKWFWRSWLLFSVVTGFTMDYFTPLEHRKRSFKEFVEEWLVEQFTATLTRFGLKKPWYWAEFLRSLDNYHHMVYASAYSYRATVWFDMAVPSPAEREWLQKKYPDSFAAYEPVWRTIEKRWSNCDAGLDFGVHGTAIVTFCNLCNLVLCHGTPDCNDANVLDHDGQRYVFCSKMCRYSFEQEPERYASHKDVVKRVLSGEAPGNLMAFLKHSGLSFSDWGKDVYAGEYAWIARGDARPRDDGKGG